MECWAKPGLAWGSAGAWSRGSCRASSCCRWGRGAHGGREAQTSKKTTLLLWVSPKGMLILIYLFWVELLVYRCSQTPWVYRALCQRRARYLARDRFGIPTAPAARAPAAAPAHLSVQRNDTCPRPPPSSWALCWGGLDSPGPQGPWGRRPAFASGATGM